jgi:hypothetical protein
MKPDALSGWSTAPRAARLVAGDEAFRMFDSAEAALAFLGQHLAKPIANAQRQRRHRQRQRQRGIALRLEVPDTVVAALVSSGRLIPQAALDKGQVSEAFAAVISDWSKAWVHFP